MTDIDPTHAIPRCGQPCWDQGPACELAPGHDQTVLCYRSSRQPGIAPEDIECNCEPIEGTPHAAPSVTQQPGRIFSGPIPSNSTPGISYHVEIWHGGRATCTCPARTTYRTDRDCSHIRLVLEAAHEAGVV